MLNCSRDAHAHLVLIAKGKYLSVLPVAVTSTVTKHSLGRKGSIGSQVTVCPPEKLRQEPKQRQPNPLLSQEEPVGYALLAFRSRALRAVTVVTEYRDFSYCFSISGSALVQGTGVSHLVSNFS